MREDRGVRKKDELVKPERLSGSNVSEFSRDRIPTEDPSHFGWFALRAII